MDLANILAIVYLVGLVATFPLILKVTRSRFKQKLQAGQIPPGTEIIALIVSPLVSALIWPVSMIAWVVELATQRLKRRQS